MAVALYNKLGFGDERWTTRDKVTQYRGLIKLYNRDKTKSAKEAAILLQRQWKKIIELRKECTSLRKYLVDTKYGDKQRLRNSLQGHRPLKLAFQRHRPEDVLEELDHILHQKRREYDKLQYRTKKKMEVFKRLRCEMAEIEDRIPREALLPSVQNRAENVILNRLEEVRLKYNTALSIRTSYENVLAILHKDSWYFDTILNALLEDSRLQCRCILRATEMGQYATEELAYIRDEYRRLEKQVKLNMRERERAVKQLQKAVNDLYLKNKALAKIELEPEGEEVERRTSDIILQEHLEELESMMKELKNVTFVPTYDDIFARMEDQVYQKERLLRQLQLNTNLRDDLINMRNHAQVMLSSLEHTVVASTHKYIEDKRTFDEEIASKQQEIEEKSLEIEITGEVLALVNVSLQTLYEMLLCVRDGKTEEIVSDGLFDDPKKRIPPPIDEDATKLLNMIQGKLTILMKKVREPEDEEMAEEAKQMHEEKKMDKMNEVVFGDETDYDMPLVGELESDDANVLSRLEIKARSKRIVDHFLKMLK